MQSSAIVQDIWTSPEEQLMRMHELSLERGWGLPDAWFSKAERSIPAWPEATLVPVTLVPYLPNEALATGKRKKPMTGAVRTFHELWDAASSVHAGRWLWESFKNTTPSKVMLLPGIRHMPGLRWEIINLGGQRNERPAEVRHPERSPHAGILAAAMLHPEWVRHMDGEVIPYVWLPGYVVSVPRERPKQSTPFLRFDGKEGEIELSCSQSSHHDADLAVPSFIS